MKSTSLGRLERLYGRSQILLNVSIAGILGVIILGLVFDHELTLHLDEFRFSFIIFALSLLSHGVASLGMRSLMKDPDLNLPRIEKLDASWVFWNEFLVAVLVPATMKQYTSILWVVSFHSVFTIILNPWISYRKKILAIFSPVATLILYTLIQVVRGNPSIHVLNLGYCALLVGLLYSSFRLLIEHAVEGRLREEEAPCSMKCFCETYDLSIREAEVFALLMAGSPSRIIADQLFISEATVKTHILNIFKKADVHSRVALLALYSSRSRRD